MLKSKSVYEEHQSYVGIEVKASSDPETHKIALYELEQFREEYYGSEIDNPHYAVISVVDKIGNTNYKFPTVYQKNGTDYNPDIYPEAIYASLDL